MTHLPTRFLINRNLIRLASFSSILRRGRLNSLILASSSSLSHPVKTPVLCSAVGVSSRKSVFVGFRASHTMASQSNQPQSVHDFTVKDAKGNDVDLSIYKGKVLLIVNVASQCGMTNSNYTELNQLYEKYRDQGLEILAFPCNQFGEEEPGSNDQILDFVCTRFKSDFPIFGKIEVNGDAADPLYKFLKLGKWGIFGDDIQWNFAKFLVDRNGQPVDRYYPTTSPLTVEVLALSFFISSSSSDSSSSLSSGSSVTSPRELVGTSHGPNSPINISRSPSPRQRVSTTAQSVELVDPDEFSFNTVKTPIHQLKEKYFIPHDYETLIPRSFDRMHRPPKGFRSISIFHLEAGLCFPLPRTICPLLLIITLPRCDWRVTKPESETFGEGLERDLINYITLYWYQPKYLLVEKVLKLVGLSLTPLLARSVIMPARIANKIRAKKGTLAPSVFQELAQARPPTPDNQGRQWSTHNIQAAPSLIEVPKEQSPDTQVEIVDALASPSNNKKRKRAKGKSKSGS
ncbi:UNVERIFIED_CONTAM: putative glutathione peroxidase 8 [Sesamum indicum]